MTDDQNHHLELHRMFAEVRGGFPKSVCLDHAKTGHGPDEYVPSCAVCGLTTMNSYFMIEIAKLRAWRREGKKK